MKFYIAAFFLVTVCVAHCQETAEALKPCVDAILNEKSNSTYYETLNYDLSKDTIDILSTLQTILNENEKYSSWSKKINKEDLEVCKLTNREKECYLLSSTYKQATGLAINFYTSLIVIPVPNGFRVIEFESLLANEELVFFDDKNGSLNYVRFTYGDNFFWSRDWENIDFKIEEYKVAAADVVLIRSKDSFCKDD